MKQLKVPLLLVLKCRFGISNGALGSAIRLSTLHLNQFKKNVLYIHIYIYTHTYTYTHTYIHIHSLATLLGTSC